RFLFASLRQVSEKIVVLGQFPRLVSGAIKQNDAAALREQFVIAGSNSRRRRLKQRNFADEALLLEEFPERDRGFAVTLVADDVDHLAARCVGVRRLSAWLRLFQPAKREQHGFLKNSQIAGNEIGAELAIVVPVQSVDELLV